MNNIFDCERCGQCCRRVGRTLFGESMAAEDGVCRYLDRETNLCSIYETRPMLCRVDEFYDAHLSSTMSREEFYRRNKDVCRQFQAEPK